jgi:hypothetical protein
MKVIYAKTIIEQIRDARRNADMDDKEIEKIVLTAMEAEKLKWEFANTGTYDPFRFCRYGELPDYTEICGIRVESEVK